MSSTEISAMRSIRKFVFVMIMGGASAAFAMQPAPAGSIEQARLWSLVDALGRAAEQDAQAVLDSWPGIRLDVSERSNDVLKVLDGGAFGIGESLKVSSSEIRILNSGGLGILILQIEGGCVSGEDVRRRYPSAALLRYPQPNNPNPYAYLRVEQPGLNASFAFPLEGADCLDRIAFNPGH